MFNSLLTPIVSKALGSLIRAGLMLVVPFLVSQGIWTPEEATATVASLTAALTALAWSLYEKYSSQRKLVTALAVPAGSTQAQVEAQVAQGLAPPVSLPKDVAPVLKESQAGEGTA